MIISASGDGEQSWEPDPHIDSSTPNSYFTHYFLENLKQSHGKIQDSFDAAVPSVVQKAMQIANKRRVLNLLRCRTMIDGISGLAGKR